jgi:hypothetical protein
MTLHFVFVYWGCECVECVYVGLAVANLPKKECIQTYC